MTLRFFALAVVWIGEIEIRPPATPAAKALLRFVPLRRLRFMALGRRRLRRGFIAFRRRGRARRGADERRQSLPLRRPAARLRPLAANLLLIAIRPERAAIAALILVGTIGARATIVALILTIVGPIVRPAALIGTIALVRAVALLLPIVLVRAALGVRLALRLRAVAEIRLVLEGALLGGRSEAVR